jgi:hypothetical protein
MIHFQACEYLRLSGQLIYRAYEYAFEFEVESHSELARRAGSKGTTSLLIGTLQIEVGIETGALLFVWGFHPHTKWLCDQLPPFSPRPGSVKVQFDEEPIVGVSQSLKEISQLRTTYDPNTGWIRISLDEDLAEDYIEFTEDTVVGLSNERLMSLWLRPVWRHDPFEEQATSLLSDSDNS